MRLFLVSHPALAPVLELLAPRSAHRLELCYLEDPAQLPALAAQTQGYDALLLPDGAYLLGGEPLIASGAPLVLPRIHNCAALLLGGAAAYRKLFCQYDGGVCFALGEALEPLHFSPPADCSCLCYLADTVMGLPDGSLQARLTAQTNGWDYFQREMDWQLLLRLLSGDWDTASFLRVPHGGAVCPVCSRELMAVQA